MSRFRGRDKAVRTAVGVTSWKATRWTGTSPMASRSVSHSSTCQAIASPSRSGSVASTRLSAFASAFATAASVRAARLPLSVTMEKPSSGLTEPAFAGRSRTWPRVAITRYSRPR